REIQHPAHPAHPLIRLDFTNTCGPPRECDACGLAIEGVPLGCPECDFDLHMRCADSLLRSVTHYSPEHNTYCFIELVVLVKMVVSYAKEMLSSLLIPSIAVWHVMQSVISSVLMYTSPLLRNLVTFILSSETPSPLYLKDLYSCGGNVARTAHQEECETEGTYDDIFVVNDMVHNHVMDYRRSHSGSIHHTLVQVLVSRSYPVACTLCDDRLYGNIVSCMDCEQIYHSRCIELAMLQVTSHPLHYDHILTMKLLTSRATCVACKMSIIEYGYICGICYTCFHLRCLHAMGISRKIENHKHYLYNYWSESLAQPCTVCSRPCGSSF
ncbi:unnamed protein product, partial [Microthlaspi erraticum]